MPLTVFISYAKEDREQALQYYEMLENEGVSPWMDVRKLLPGQNWEAEIERALSSANLVILLLSPRSVSKRGFVQREANEAIARLKYKLPTDIYVIPLLLEVCEVPDFIGSKLQYVDLSAPNAWSLVRASLQVASEQQSVQLSHGTIHGPFTVFEERLKETWIGLPGHDIEISYPRIQSSVASAAAKELSQIFEGRAAKAILDSRQKPWDQSPDLFEGRHPESASNGRWDNYGIAHASTKLLSISYLVAWYGAGAAHPNSHFETHCFAILDKIYPLTLEDFFNEPGVASIEISRACIAALGREFWSRAGERPDNAQLKWFADGAGPNLENFRAFTVHSDRFTFLFSPYQVAAYAFGAFSIEVPFYDLLEHLRSDGPYTWASDKQQG